MSKYESNDPIQIVTQALSAIKERDGSSYEPSKVNLAELHRMTGLSRSRLRRLKKNGFKDTPNANKGRKAASTVLDGFTDIIDDYLRNSVTNSEVIFDHLCKSGYRGGRTTVKNYIHAHLDLVPAKRVTVSPQGNRGRRYQTEPGKCFQMDWGFVDVSSNTGGNYRCACFAMICHHCGERYIEFFPNAKQENLFIGMIHAFIYLGIPESILTDNMKSVTLGRDCDGNPIWQKDYAVFMKEIGFNTKLCKPRHPFTKGSVERLVRFVKENFIAGRVFGTITDLNIEALKWCNEQNGRYHKATDCVPNERHTRYCRQVAKTFVLNEDTKKYLCPLRKISFDGFVNYEGRRFGVPYTYTKKLCRICREEFYLHIYDVDLTCELAKHNVTWSRKDSYCPDQYVTQQPEEFPTAPITASLQQYEQPDDPDPAFRKFAFESKVK